MADNEAAEVSARNSQVDLLLVKKDKVGALLASLSNPPVNTKDEAVKKSNADIVEKVLAQFSESDIPNAINALDNETADILMKYVYRLMGQSREKSDKEKFNYALVLKLHAQLVEKAGVGSIVRVMTDRKQV